MKLTIKNLGVIESAEINVQGLTILAGGNGSGKTTVAKAFDAIANAILRKEQIRNRYLINFYLDSIRKYLLNFPEINTLKRQRFFFPKTNREILEFFEDVKNGSFEGIVSYLTNFYSDSRNAASHNSARPIPLNILANDFKHSILPEISADIRRLGSDFRVSTIDFMEANLEHYLSKESEIRLLSGSEGSDFLFFGDYDGDSLEINILQDEFFNAIISYIDLDLNSLDELYTGNNYELGNHLKDLLSNIIGGTIDDDEFSDFQFTDKDGQKFSMDIVASGIKALAPLYRLLHENKLQPNTVLIIDEPETNLHTEWQIKFADLLTQLVKHGVTLIISTHSPIFASALERYSKKNEIDNVTSWYLATKSEVNGKATFKDCSNDFDQLLNSQFAPFHRIVWADDDEL